MQMRRRRGDLLTRRIAKIVETDRCTGCGACALLDSRVSMHQQGGFSRPVVSDEPADPRAVRSSARTFRKICPGAVVRAQSPPGSTRDPDLGPILGIWEAHATDAEVRSRGSSGGVLTALASWLSETGRAAQVIGARADTQDPRRTVTVSLTSREEALAAAGSRYAPVSNAAHPLAMDPNGGFIGKPCEASALRALAQTGCRDPGYSLSFFCAGTPNQAATDRLVRDLGVDADKPLRDLWYRGRGWPGRFTAVPRTGVSASASYQESWGKSLGPTVQWRCRLCADGVGESSDVTAGDFWRADRCGYPDFDEHDGVSVLIARTPRGLALVQEAAEAGVVHVSPIEPAEVTRVQPYQIRRRRYLLGRMAGTLAFLRPVTRYRGFGLLGFALRSPRRTWAEFRGTMHRTRRRSHRQ